MTFLLTWNPARWSFPDNVYEQHVEQTNGPFPRPRPDRWSTGTRSTVIVGERVFLLRLGEDRPGIVAAGRVVSQTRREPHWDPVEANQGKTALFAEVLWDRVVDPEDGVAIEELEAEVDSVYWHPQGGGVSLDDDEAERVEELFMRSRSLARYREPSGRVAAEATQSAVDLLRRLLGADLRDPGGGRAYRITAVSPSAATVETGLSKDPRTIPLTRIEETLSALRDGGSRTIGGEPGWQAGFIEAVLRTLPGAWEVGGELGLGPPRDDVDAGEGKASFNERLDVTGPLDRLALSRQRAEQTALRARLFGTRTDQDCALCRRRFPVEFLRAAHIKRRSVCSDEEKTNPHIAMAACVFGCDALFEAGYLAADATGTVVADELIDPAGALAAHLTMAAGGRCLAFNEANRDYFAWHRNTVFRGRDTERGVALDDGERRDQRAEECLAERG